MSFGWRFRDAAEAEEIYPGQVTVDLVAAAPLLTLPQQQQQQQEQQQQQQQLEELWRRVQQGAAAHGGFVRFKPFDLSDPY
ncbi:hypothetical protein, conserved [Eimeria tenella]|uniref:Uncharacterized protein n=1 Tax=Eimeria tenella TaxID=5802 RepID=U6L019_EIMTE|nr:hypothetical protein, conserved [Eimeria tenella]CDJ43772.1 hypothetical protein, conserved [Eimeria tenella]|eukprot:XP_013234521.1 hypothetical protein, conserved [Eimeria tenella]